MKKKDLIKRLKKVAIKPKVSCFISKVDKKRKRIIINNRKEFSEKNLYN